MLSKSDDELITARLRNWGRAIADHKLISASPLYWLRVSASIANGSRKSAPEPFDVIDYADADEIQTAWRRLPEYPERYRKAKRVILFWYAYPYMTRRKIRNLLRIRDSNIDRLHEMGKVLLFSHIYGLKPQNNDLNPNKTQNDV